MNRFQFRWTRACFNLLRLSLYCKQPHISIAKWFWFTCFRWLTLLGSQSFKAMDLVDFFALQTTGSFPYRFVFNMEVSMHLFSYINLTLNNFPCSKLSNSLKDVSKDHDIQRMVFRRFYVDDVRKMGSATHELCRRADVVGWFSVRDEWLLLASILLLHAYAKW